MIENWIYLPLFTGLAVFLLAGALSPLESLAWWAGWQDGARPPQPVGNEAPLSSSEVFVIFLAGIDSISGDVLTTKAQKLLAGIAAGAPNVELVSNVFPYAHGGAPLLAGPRIFLRIWRFIDRIKRSGKAGALAYLINFRNFYQVLVSADHRYGPLFNAGAAEAMMRALAAQGYDPAAKKPIVMIGYSGGAQVALGAAEFLKVATGARLSVISIGGTMASTPGIAAVNRIDHFCGRKDRIERLAALMFPERWPVFASSHWNIAKMEGRVRRQIIGGMGHDGPNGYLGDELDGESGVCVDKTTKAVLTAILREVGLALDQSPRRPPAP